MKPTAADIAHAPDALIINHVAPGEVPYDVPDGWRFELRPPWHRIPLSLAHDLA
jgi:hypothetical protein